MRRTISIIGLALLLVACGRESTPPETSQPPGPGVRIIHNAVIHTVDARAPLAQAMAFTKDGEILLLGDDEAVLAAYAPAEVLDLEGKTVIPGLIDAHAHLDGLAESYTQAQLAGTRDVDEIIERLRAHEATLGGEDWLLGRGWDQNDWPVREFPTRRDLDEHFPERPVWLRRIDGHAGWANSAALAMVDRDLSGGWQEQGGHIHRDAGGEATGVLVDGAMAMVDVIVPPTSDAAMMQALDLALGEMVRLGLTGVHDPGIELQALDRYRRKIAVGRFPTRVYAMAEGLGAAFDWLCADGPLTDPSGRLFMRSVKLYADGALGSRGAALLADYADDPGNAGLLFLAPEAMHTQVDRVMECDLQAAIHAIGDRGNRVAIDALEAGMASHPGNPGRHRVEHAQVLHADDVPRFGALGIIAAMQPTHATSDMYWAEDRVGPERIRFAYAWRSLLDSGAVLALGSDFPVEEVNPMHGIYAAVTRRDHEGWPEGGWYPGEAVTREEALRGFTLDAAFAGFMEDMVGSLEPGKRADFLVLDRDIMSVPVEEIPLIQVLESWLDGKQVFAANH